MKIAIPAMNIRRLPRMSPALPPSSRSPPKVSEYAFRTHDRPEGEKSRPCAIEGSATFTTVRSRTIMSWAQSTTARVMPRRTGRRAGGVMAGRANVVADKLSPIFLLSKGAAEAGRKARPDAGR